MIINTILGYVVGICIGGLVLLAISTRDRKHKLETARRLERIKVIEEMESKKMNSIRYGKMRDDGIRIDPGVCCKYKTECVNYEGVCRYGVADCANFYGIISNREGILTCKNHTQFNRPPKYDITDICDVGNARRIQNKRTMRAIVNHFNNNTRYNLSLDNVIRVERVLNYSRERIASYDVDMGCEAMNMSDALKSLANSISCDREHDFHRVEEQEIRGFAGKILLIVGEANR